MKPIHVILGLGFIIALALVINYHLKRGGRMFFITKDYAFGLDNGNNPISNLPSVG